MRNLDWVDLNDAQRGQLISIWLLAADYDGVIPASPRLLKQLCYMDSEPDIELFINHGFIERDASVTPVRRQHDHPETETETEIDAEAEADKRSTPSAKKNGAYRITPDWQPDSRALEWIASFGVTINDAVHVVVEFRTYWLSRTTKRKDWSLTFIRNGKVEGSLLKLKDRGTNNGNQWQKTRVEQFYDQLLEHARTGPAP